MSGTPRSPVNTPARRVAKQTENAASPVIAPTLPDSNAPSDFDMLDSADCDETSTPPAPTDAATGSVEKPCDDPSEGEETGGATNESDTDMDADLIHMETLRTTTSTHDDWLHRGPYLYDVGFHTYAEYVDRVRLPRKSPAGKQLFLFEPHYILSRTYCQQITTPARLPVLEALRFVPPGEGMAEENALYKHLVGSSPGARARMDVLTPC